MIVYKPLPIYYLALTLILAFIVPYILIRRELRNLKKIRKRKKVVKKLRKFNFLEILDLFAPYIALSFAIGWVGGFLSWVGHGKPADIPFAVWVNNVPYYPTQIYLIIGNLIIFLALLYLRKRTDKQIIKQKGDIFFLFLILYSILNFIVDFFRLYSQKEFLIGLAISQWICIVLIFFSIAVLILRNIK